jgi:hypothetical protein
MAAIKNTGSGSRDQAVPAMQQVLDNPLLLFTASCSHGVLHPVGHHGDRHPPRCAVVISF